MASCVVTGQETNFKWNNNPIKKEVYEACRKYSQAKGITLRDAIKAYWFYYSKGVDKKIEEINKATIKRGENFEETN